jgi:hypothetical protein
LSAAAAVVAGNTSRALSSEKVFTLVSHCTRTVPSDGLLPAFCAPRARSRLTSGGGRGPQHNARAGARAARNTQQHVQVPRCCRCRRARAAAGGARARARRCTTRRARRVNE